MAEERNLEEENVLTQDTFANNNTTNTQVADSAADFLLNYDDNSYPTGDVVEYLHFSDEMPKSAQQNVKEDVDILNDCNLQFWFDEAHKEVTFDILILFQFLVLLCIFLIVSLLHFD